MRRRRPALERNAAVLIWVPVLLAQPVISSASGTVRVSSLALAALAAAACVLAVVASWPAPTRRSTLGWLLLAAAVATGSLLWTPWQPAWLLVSMAAGACFARPRWMLLVAATAVAAMATSAIHPEQSPLSLAFTVVLAGTTAGVISDLVKTTETLRSTRRQLAAVAVGQERERMARDLHDLLGHTLSTMVVKAAAVRRLVDLDPDAAVVHAADIEDIGRSALTRVRQTIANTNPLTLSDEVMSARRTLDAAGISADLPDLSEGSLPDAEPLAWALREAITNVVRHSRGGHCTVVVSEDERRLVLTVSDDGAGGRSEPTECGGLAGLGNRLALNGGGIDTTAADDGFTLTAWLPKETVRS